MAKAHRTYWKVRQRYRRAGYLGSILGGFGAAAVVAPIVHGAQWTTGEPLMPTLLQWAAVCLGAVAVPLVAARAAWRVHRQRFFDDMYQITQR